MTSRVIEPLAGMTVLVTRPAGQGEGLAQLITAAGGRAVQAPLLRIAPSGDSSAAASLLNSPESWDWLIFVSANAVRFALGLDGGLELRGGTTRIAAVGEATAAALAGAGLTVDLVPYPQFNSEALLADPRMAAVAGQRVLVVRGEGGREHLADILRERGAEVVYAEVYRRVPVQAEEFSPSLTALQEGIYDAVVVTSGEALAHLTGLLRESGLDSLPRPAMVVPSERIADQAREQGWSKRLIAEQASDEAIVQALKQFAHARKTGQGPVTLEPLESDSTTPEPETTIAPAGELIEGPAVNIESDQNGDKPLTNQEQDIRPSVESTHETEPAAVQDATTATVKGKPPKKPRSLAWVGYMVLLGVIGLAAGGWFLLQELRSRQEGLGGQITDKTHQVQEVTHQITSVQSDIAALHSQVATLQSQFSGNDAKIERRLGDQAEQWEVKLESTRGELSTAIQQIQRQLNKTRSDLLITDAEYLLSVANQKLHLVGDVKSVLAAMEAADQRLHESGDPAVYKVRQALAEEMAAVRKIQAPDLVGFSSRLIALEKKVPSLPLLLPHAGTVKQHEKEKEQQSQAEEQGPEEKGDAFDSALRGFKDLVTVRRTDQPVEALLVPEQVEVLRQLLLLKLESSRAALLRNDEQLYRDSLATAMDWIGQHFDTAAAETKAMLDDLNALADRSFTVAYPDISKSMVMLQNIEKLRLEAEDAAMRGNSAPGASGASPAAASPAPAIEPPVTPVNEASVPRDVKGKKSEKPVPGKKGKSGEKAEAPAAEMPVAIPAPAGAGSTPSVEPVQESVPEAAPGNPPAMHEAKPIEEPGERL